MARKATPKVWYEKYLKGYIRQLWQWSPERKAIKKRARINKTTPELFRCERCDAQPLGKGDYEINHIEPCESVEGWDKGEKWNGFITRTVEPGEDGAELICKPCHRKITNEQNKARRANNGKQKV